MVGQMIRTVLGAGSQQRRVTRSPKHQWYLKTRPWQIQPCFIAPVLPGETLKNLTLQARVVSDPINSPLIGWWNETYVFYVKLRDMYARDLLTSMLLKPEVSLAALDDATDANYYHVNGTYSPAINWPKRCLEMVVDNYFRNEGEVTTDYTINGMPAASVGMDNALDSAINALTIEGAAGVDQDLASAVAGQGDATTKVLTSEIEKAMKEYAYASMNKLTDMTFEDWCAEFGVTMAKAEQLFKPELIRYSRDWTYPTNTIDPTNGTPRSAVSWSTAMRADKDRYFKEPGFLLGVSVIRPKIYYKNMRSHMTELMNDAYSWLPPTLQTDVWASFKKVPAGDPPLTVNTDAYYVDIKDLFIYGDQFTNQTLTAATGMNIVALPNAALTNKRYPASTDADALFVDNTAGLGKVSQDGICELHILGRQVETSPSDVGTNKTV